MMSTKLIVYIVKALVVAVIGYAIGRLFVKKNKDDE